MPKRCSTDGPSVADALLPPPVPAGHFDELRADDGAMRAPWGDFYETLGCPGPETLVTRAAAVARQVRDNGVTFNVHAEADSARDWPLELLPFLITEDDWATIEAGVTQRAVLANAIMGDIYGPQILLERGLLPPGLVFGHPGYLRGLKGYRPPGGSFLQIVAVDLVHGEAGWTVLAHRTETPAGMGYALENRLIVAGQLAEAFRAQHVRRLPPAFAQLISTLTHLPLEGISGERHLVLLTPGPSSAMYFEHAFLARYLGVTLVEGGDLTVRNDVVYLKTFGGLERVDVILRRVDDVLCDPLELRADSMVGVPGLLEAMRAGNVLISNMPGSGFLESPAIHGFLPGIAEALLGEPLRLPDVATWWCGEAAARERVFEALSEAYVMPTYPQSVDSAEGAEGMDDEGYVPGQERGIQALRDWRARVERMPDRYTIQAPLALSHTPCWESADGRMRSRAAMVRVYAVSDGNGGWQVMPGGFTRLAPTGADAVSMRTGGTSADTWVLSTHPIGATPLTARTGLAAPAAQAQAALTVSSRAAENLYWGGRYAERAENTVRLCRQILGSIERHEETDEGALAMIGSLARWFGLVPEDAPTPDASAPPSSPASLAAFERSLVMMLADPSGRSGVMYALAGHARAASQIRNRLSNDHWRTILAARNDFRAAMADAVTPAEGGGAGSGDGGVVYDRARVLAALDYLSMQLGAISGAQGDRMTRDEAWRLVFIGRHIERIGGLAPMLETAVETGALLTRGGFDLLLHLFDSTLTFRSRYPGRTDLAALVQLLVIEPTNPRGLYGVLERLRDKLAQIPAGSSGQARVPLVEMLPPASALPSLTRLVEADAGVTEQRRHAKLAALCDHLGERMARISEEIASRYFSHAGAAPGRELS
ncbi:circularly permuted type 2 ATP-grasp protein [Cupriavidus plantarum]|uniref:circularly permuted type 2 ATP-grasp protein n=1 Tax=Cupriavidus plantarum TaxID=942865 RepID=UPI00339D4CA3